MESTRLFALLRGSRWAFARAIQNLATAEAFSVTGAAAFEEVPEAPARLRYTEQGSMLQAHPDPAAQLPPMEVRAEHVWHFDAAEAAAVFFADGRPFHTVPLPSLDAQGQSSAAFTHYCHPDTYEGALEFSAQRMRLKWRITGPHKDMQIETLFSRGAEGPAAGAGAALTDNGV